MDSKDVRREAPTDKQIICTEGKPGSGDGKWSAVFTYSDGTVQSFDGTKWKQIDPIKRKNIFTDPRS